MSANPFFSIIIATKNRQALLKECIDSVLAQTYTDYELIIVDDHSNDNTAHMIADLGHHLINYAMNDGEAQSAATNKGISLALGQYICVIDDDDNIEPNYLKDFWIKLQELSFPKNIILRTGFKYFYEDGRIKKSPNFNETYTNKIDYVTKVMCSVATLCIPISLFKEDLYDERYTNWIDTHLILRLLSRADLLQLDSYNYNYRIHGKMGSLEVIDEHALSEKCRLNIDPMDDIYYNYGIITKDRLNWMKAKKYLEYGTRSRSNKLYYFRKSTCSSIKLELYKQYYFFLKSIIL